MKEDHEPGRCYACRKDTQVRWKNLFTIGSEGTWLCMPCEMIVVNLLRKLARKAMLAYKKERVARIISTRSTS
jgi:hypothetical protein